MDELGGSRSSRITSGGLATGLNTNALIDALIDVERCPRPAPGESPPPVM